MGKYRVIAGQNLYDIALHIYGSIEGIVDLMMCNTDLSLDTTLKVGDELAPNTNPKCAVLCIRCRHFGD